MYQTDTTSALVSKRASDFDVELCHAFFSVVSDSDLICKPCKQGLTQRYLHSKAQNDLVFRAYRRINELDRPLLGRLIRDLGGPQDFERAIQDLNNAPHPSQAPDGTGPKQWDCADVETWGKLHVWLRILAREESVVPHPLTKRAFKTSAWRSRAWAAAAGRYTLDDLRNGRSIQRFLEDHEARLLEASLWAAEARIPKLAKYEITPAACECFPLGDGTVTFQDTVQALVLLPELLRDPGYVRLRRQAVVARLVGGCFDLHIVEGVFMRCPPPPAPETADPFRTFVEYWDSAPIRQAVRGLLGLAHEASPDSPAAGQVTKPEKKPSMSRACSMRRGATFKHPSVEIGYQEYHPLISCTAEEGPVDYEAEARKIRSQDNMEIEDWLDA